MPSLSKNIGQLDPSFIASGYEKWYTHCDKHLSGFLICEACTFHTIQPLYSQIITQEKKKCMSKLRPYVNVYSSIIQNSHKLETAQLFINKKQITNKKLCYIHTRYCLSAMTHATTEINLKSIILSDKKPDMKHCILYDSKYMTVQKRQNYRDKKQISSFQSLGVRRVNFNTTEHKKKFEMFEIVYILSMMLIT